MKFSLMTMSLFFPIADKFYIYKDEEEMRDNYVEMLNLITEAGYTTVDIISTEVRLLGKEYVKKELNARNLKVACYIHIEIFDGIENEQTAVDNAKFLGADMLMLVPGYSARYEDKNGQQIRDDLVERWIPVVKYAKVKGIKIAIEEWPDLRMHLCSSTEVADVLNRVDGLSFVYDCANMLFAHEDPVEYYRIFCNKVVHVHLKDLANNKEDRAVYLGKGIVDLKKVIQTLKDDNYEGYITVEFAVDEVLGYKKSLIETLKFVKSL